MRKQSASFEELVLENKRQILEDPKALERIDERLDERAQKELEMAQS